MKRLLLLSPLIIFLMSFAMKGDNKPAYILFDGKGKKTTYSALLAKAKEADIILFGEYHNNPICHWLQYELTKDVHAFKKENLVLGAEMFEADNQQALNNYLAGKIEKKALKDSVRLWPNYKTDYEPLVEFAKTNKLAFIACNVPRKYANLVYMKGTEALDTLSAREKAWLCPLPFKYDPELKCYKDIFESAGGHGGQNLPKSQALKDATMAHFIMANWSPGKTFIHYNGAYHSDYHQSINWYINQQKPGLKVLVISTTEQEKMDALNKEDYDRGDFIICTPASMTKTH